MPDNSSSKTFNNLYIDTIYIDNNSSTDLTTSDGYTDNTNGNYLTNASDPDSNLSLVKGSKWILQVTNGSGGLINFNSNNFKLNICTNFKDSAAENSDNDFNYHIKSGSLSAGASMYFGWGNSTVSGGVLGLASGTNINDFTLATQGGSGFGSLDGLLIPGLAADQSTSVNYLLLADQIVGSNILCNTRFRLHSGSFIENVGLNTDLPNNDGENITSLTYSIKKFILYTTGSNTGTTKRSESSGYFTRNPTVSSTNAPTSTYAESDWTVKTVHDKNLYGTALGDPHIHTIYGENYKFDYLGAFRLFDNNEELSNRIVINGYSELGKGEKWKENQYITKIFIFHKGNYCLINTGNRGEKVKVEQNYGIYISEKELEFDDSARSYCLNCTRNINHKDVNKIYKHKKKYNHKIPYCVRNIFTIRLELENYEDLVIEVSNVNAYNLQPCRIKILSNPYLMENKNNFSGCIVDRKYSVTSQLDDINSLDKIEEPTKKDLLKLPKLEIKPELINKMFN